MSYQSEKITVLVDEGAVARAFSSTPINFFKISCSFLEILTSYPIPPEILDPLLSLIQLNISHRRILCSVAFNHLMGDLHFNFLASYAVYIYK